MKVTFNYHVWSESDACEIVDALEEQGFYPSKAWCARDCWESERPYSMALFFTVDATSEAFERSVIDIVESFDVTQHGILRAGKAKVMA